MQNLIDGLPDAVAIRCLACVPFSYHPHMQLVCQSWRATFRNPEIVKTRQEVGATEEFLCVLAFEPENVWQLYDPLRDLWMTLPLLPSEIRHIARFGVASVDSKLFVLGGGSDKVDPSTGDHDGIFATNEVWSYDPLVRQWSKRAPMLVPRALFAFCALNGIIVVAGCFTNLREKNSNATTYDPVKDFHCWWGDRFWFYKSTHQATARCGCAHSSRREGNVAAGVSYDSLQGKCAWVCRT